MQRFLFLAAVIVGCSSANEEDEFNYDRADVESALTGTWTGSFATGRAGTLTLNLSLAPAAQTKCANRTLSMKCMTMSTASLVGTLTTSDGALKDVRVQGSVMIDGTEFRNGYISLSTTDGLVFNANYNSSTLKDGTLRKASDTSTFTLTRN